MTRIRQAIVADPERWRAATREPPFSDVLGLGGDNERLKRVPTGFPADHEFADDLRRRSYFGWAQLSEEIVTAPAFLDEYVRICQAGVPLVRFICDALDLDSRRPSRAPTADRPCGRPWAARRSPPAPRR